MPHMLPGTTRQLVTASDGTKLQRQYIYLPAEIWQALQQQARTANTSVSLLISSFADHGTAHSKDINDATSTHPCNI